MTCDRQREFLLLRTLYDLPESLRDHLDGCTACAAFVQRLAVYRSEMADFHSPAEAPGDFSARVLAQLPRAEPDLAEEAIDLIAWASLRWLPISAALVLVLGLWTAAVSPPEDASLLMPLLDEDKVILWLLQAEASE